MRQKHKKEKLRKSQTVRRAGKKVWHDNTLLDWPEDDYRLFIGNIGKEVSDDVLGNAFRRYKSFQKAKVIRDQKSFKNKGYGFVSLKDPHDFLKALKEMNRQYVGNCPIVVKKSSWKERCFGSKKNKKSLIKHFKMFRNRHKHKWFVYFWWKIWFILNFFEQLTYL